MIDRNKQTGIIEQLKNPIYIIPFKTKKELKQLLEDLYKAIKNENI